MTDKHTQSAPSTGSGDKQWPKDSNQASQEAGSELTWALQAINIKSKFVLEVLNLQTLHA